jgi:hypothetical protein
LSSTLLAGESVAVLTTTHRRSSARREFFRAASARADSFAENAETLSRSHVHTPLGRAHSNHAIIGVKGALRRLIKTINRP